MTIRALLSRAVDILPEIGRVVRDVKERQAIKGLTWAEVPGYSFRLRGGNWIAAGWRPQHGAHENTELQIVESLLSGAEILLDVGANSGIFSCLAASVGVRSLAFEPLPANLQILLGNIEQNGFQAAVEVFPLALSDTVGIAPFYGRGQGASLIEGWGGASRYDRMMVPINRLDDLAYHRIRGRKFVLKIDVEGAELAVLRGAERVLSERPPALAEVSLIRNQPTGFNPYFMPIFELMWQHGYDAFVANEERTPVSQSMVRDWVERRSIAIGTENFLFL